MKILKNKLDKYKEYQEKLFARGYLISKKKISNIKEYPFYNNWNEIKLSNYNVYIHNYQKHYHLKYDNLEVLLIGHAYDPVNMVYDENIILENILNKIKINEELFFRYIDNVSGIYVILVKSDDKEYLVQDCCGIMPAYYGECNGNYYITSHAQLVADIENLEMDEKIKKYVNSNFYKIGIRQLCGVKSPFCELKMLSANTFLDLFSRKIERFYPYTRIELPNGSYENVYNEIELILKNSIDLCSKKWNSSISLTGGIDSKMTLASANGKYDKFKYFSFISSEAERKDAEAARNICNKMNLNHKIFEIPKENSDIVDFDILSLIEEHNLAHMWKFTEQEMRKILYLNNELNIDLEIKSHVNEVGRAFYYKKLGKKKFKYPLKPRDMSNLAKRNFFNRRILKDMDEAFNEFKYITKFGDFYDGYDESDMFYWENRMSAWASLVKQSFDISHETTIIYNNRKLLENFLKFDLNYRKNDIPHNNVIKNLNKELFDLNINNNNAMKNKRRVLIENIFFNINRSIK